MSQFSNHSPEVIDEANGFSCGGCLRSVSGEAGSIMLPQDNVQVYYHVTYTLGHGKTRQRCISPSFLDRRNAVAYAAGKLAGDEHLGIEPARRLSIVRVEVSVPW
jgi:hypothetical protein